MTPEDQKYLEAVQQLRAALGLDDAATEPVVVSENFRGTAEVPIGIELPYIEPSSIEDPEQAAKAGVFNVASLLGVFPPARRRQG